jgi:RNA polymerase sigma-70 factor (ECF subfamily)
MAVAPTAVRHFVEVIIEVSFLRGRRSADKEADAGRRLSGDTANTPETVRDPRHPQPQVRTSVRAMETVAEAVLDPIDVRAAGLDVVGLFAQEAASLTRLARFYLEDRTAAEDLVQEAFIRLSRSAGRIRKGGSEAAYLRSIVINLARDHNRRGLVSLRHRPSALPDSPSAEEDASARAERQEVIEALRTLPRRQRDCVTLRYYLDLSIPDIAETLGLSANTVKTHLQRGLASLALTLEAKR